MTLLYWTFTSPNQFYWKLGLKSQRAFSLQRRETKQILLRLSAIYCNRPYDGWRKRFPLSAFRTALRSYNEGEPLIEARWIAFSDSNQIATVAMVAESADMSGINPNLIFDALNPHRVWDIIGYINSANGVSREVLCDVVCNGQKLVLFAFLNRETQGFYVL